MNNIQFFTTDVAIRQRSNDDLRISPGNVIPHEWYKRFQDKESNPDLVSITILGDLVSWFRNGTSKNYGDHNPCFDCDELCLSYEYFQNKFSFNKDRTRRALVRLEQFGVLSRRVGNTLLSSGGRVNRLYISLNKEFFDSCFVDSNLDIRVLPASNKINTLSLHQCYHHISNKNNDLKNRSMESNFYQNSFEEKERKEESNVGAKEDKKYYNESREEKQTIGSLKSCLFARPKKLEEFYPLTNEDGDQLRSNSGREFSLKAMNEILLSLTKKLPNHTFPNKSAFMGYMSKVFAYEMRDEVKISNETFRIKINMNAEDREWSLQEKYLSQIENSLEVSPEWHLRRRIASVLERKKAYEILTSLRWVKRVGVGKDVGEEEEFEEGKVGRSIGNEEQEDTLILVLNKEIELSLMDKEILLSQVKATHDGVGNSERRIGRIKFQGPKKETVNKLTQSEILSEAEQQRLGQQGTWYQIRKEIKKYIGEDGDAIDKSWFSKLIVEEDEQNKSLTLKASSEFVKDWVEQNYNWLIEKSCTQFNYKHNFA